ncbi:MAG: ATP-NAD kinase family protein [Thermoplasmata archaeon]|nr:ATP-NAD kinase family protein [Thermoplasmata archaeon]
MMKLGFLVNPIAGMGGRVGLKGTDGMLQEAIKRGAEPVAPEKAIQFLKTLKERKIDLQIFTVSGEMGHNECRKAGLEARVIYKCNEPSSYIDTINACKEFLKIGVDAIIFVGGDGTARDIYSVVKDSIVMLGIPAGVKMYSGVFAFTPEQAAEVIEDFDGFEEREIMDIDEEAFRKGIFRVKLIGYAVTFSHKKVQHGKDIVENEGKEEIAEWIIENMEKDVVYIIGSGSTTWAIKKALGIDGSFLGIDVIKNGKLLCRDADEKSILKNLNGRAKIIVSPLGGHGFIFGRGNQQISSKVIKKVGKDGIIVVATKGKLSKLDSLKIDTGDENLNKAIRGYIKVITGYNESKIMKVI